MLSNKITTREIIDTTVEEVANAVNSTMGPNGKVVVINNGGYPKVTKDGVSVAKNIEFEDKRKNLIANMLTEPCIRTDEYCGDGTTTTMFLTNALYKAFKDDFNFSNTKLLESMVEAVKESIKSLKIDVTKDSKVLRSLALTTSNNDKELADTVIKIYSESKGTPNIKVREGVDDKDVVETRNGTSFLMSYAHPSFSPNGANGNMLMTRTIPMVIDNNLNNVTTGDLQELINYTLRTRDVDEETTLLIIGRMFDTDFINQLLMLSSELYNATRKKFSICAAQVTARGSSGSGIMNDIATVLGVDCYRTLSEACSKDIPTYNGYLIIGPKITVLENISEETKKVIQERANQIIEEYESLDVLRRKSAYGSILNSRISLLIGGEVTIFVGGVTESDIKERLDRYVDVSKAVKSSFENGVIPGVGFGLAYAAVELNKDERFPKCELKEKLFNVLVSQYEYLMGTRFSSIEAMRCINLATGESSNNPADIGVYDPMFATILALDSGLRTAKLLANTNNIVMGSKYGQQRVNF